MKQQLHPNVNYIRTALSWDSEGKPDCDLDLSAFLLNSDSKVRGDDDLIYYNTEVALFADQAFIHGGDSRRGSAGDGIDETILAVLDKIDEDICRVAFCVTVVSAAEKQCFSSANHAVFTASIVEDPFEKEGTELCRVDLIQDHADCIGAVVFDLCRTPDGWAYDVRNESVPGGLAELCEQFGMTVAVSKTNN